MKVIKGEKYICSNGPKKGMIFKVMAFTQFHIACENLTDPSMGVEMIVKYYFLNSFKEYNHNEIKKLDGITIQQIAFAINLRLKTYADSNVIPDSLFRLMANDVGNVLITEFGSEI